MGTARRRTAINRKAARMGIPKNVIACQIYWNGFTVQCNTERSREQNLSKAWAMLVKMLEDYHQGLPPASKGEFDFYGGKVTYYKSF